MVLVSNMQCVIVKGGVRCTTIKSDVDIGITVPIVKPEAVVFICVTCLDEMVYVAHLPEAKLMEGLK